MQIKFPVRPLGCAALLLALAGCGGVDAVSDDSADVQTAMTAAPREKAAPVAEAPTGTAEQAPAAAPQPEKRAAVPGRAAPEFARAVGLMRAGDATQAALEFQLMTEAYPELPGPYVNLAILHRKAGKLADAEAVLRSGGERAAPSALLWTELGVTLRQAGKFAAAREAYEKAIAIDRNYAAAHRNLGVLLDLYLNDPVNAQTAFETYKSLTGEDKPVSGWIAELRQRTNRAAPRQSAPAETPTEQATEPATEATPATPPQAGPGA